MGQADLSQWQAKRPAAKDLDAELAGIAGMTIDGLRKRWRLERGREPPDAFSRDLLARVLAHDLQEKVLGGLDARIKKIIAGYSPGGTAPPRRVKVGSVVVREYQGKLHEVLVVPDGFRWQGQIFASLTTIARKITGTSWNGPRFFGLRGATETAVPEAPDPATDLVLDPVTRRPGSIPSGYAPRKKRGGE